MRIQCSMVWSCWAFLEALYSVFSCHRSFNLTHLCYIFTTSCPPPSSPFSCSSFLHPPPCFLLFSPYSNAPAFWSKLNQQEQAQVYGSDHVCSCSLQPTTARRNGEVKLKGVAGRIKGLNNVMFDFKTVTRSFAACRMLQVLCVG